jgi:hypothetical protein
MEYKVKKENIVKLTKYLEKKYEYNRMGTSTKQQQLGLGKLCEKK